MALISDTVTIITLTKNKPLAYAASSDANAPQPTPVGAVAGWIELQFATDGATVWRPIYDQNIFAALTIGAQSPVSFG